MLKNKNIKIKKYGKKPEKFYGFFVRGQACDVEGIALKKGCSNLWRSWYSWWIHGASGFLGQDHECKQHRVWFRVW